MPMYGQVTISHLDPTWGISNMSAYLISITLGGGVPIFTRKIGDLKQIPFPILASLNGVSMFASSNDVSLLTATSEDCKVLWRDYHNSIRLILVTPNDTVSDIHSHRLLDNVFQAMILIVGLDELIAQRNIDRTKRDLRASFCLIDHLLSTFAPSEGLTTLGDLVGAADTVVFPEANLIQNFLESFVESVDSTYGCVMVGGGRLACATSNWWSLHPDEIALLSLYVSVDSWAALRDTPVFLPVKSPTVPFRLVTCDLIDGVTLCVLCGPAPLLPEVERQIARHWRTSYNLMASLASVCPRNFPGAHVVDPSIFGFILVNLEKRRVLSSMYPSGSTSLDTSASSDQAPVMSLSWKLDVLRTFYRTVVGAIFPEAFIPSPHAMNHKGEFASLHVAHRRQVHHVSETYLTSEYHKCMGVVRQQYQFFAIFAAAVPNHSMRSIMHRTLDTLLREKQFTIIR